MGWVHFGLWSSSICQIKNTFWFKISLGISPPEKPNLNPSPFVWQVWGGNCVKVWSSSIFQYSSLKQPTMILTLEMLPVMLKHVPEIELHCYYLKLKNYSVLVAEQQFHRYLFTMENTKFLALTFWQRSSTCTLLISFEFFCKSHVQSQTSLEKVIT